MSHCIESMEIQIPSDIGGGGGGSELQPAIQDMKPTIQLKIPNTRKYLPQMDQQKRQTASAHRINKYIVRDGLRPVATQLDLRATWF